MWNHRLYLDLWSEVAQLFPLKVKVCLDVLMTVWSSCSDLLGPYCPEMHNCTAHICAVSLLLLLSLLFDLFFICHL